MPANTSDNPYHASAIPADVDRQRTPRGYSPGQCLRRFFVVGIVGGILGGTLTSALNSLSVPTLIQFVPVGIAFGVSLWVAIGLFIDRLSIGRTALLIPGCLAGFAITPIVTLQTMPRGGFIPQPWTWQLCWPYVIGPAIGALVIVLTVRAVSGRVSLRVLFLVWLFISFFGFLAFFIVDDFGMRTRQIDEAALAFFCGGGFIATVLSLVGWQLAEASSEQSHHS